MSAILFVYLINDYCQRVFLRLSMTRITGDRCISTFCAFKLYRTFKVFFQLIVFKKNFVKAGDKYIWRDYLWWDVRSVDYTAAFDAAAVSTLS